MKRRHVVGTLSLVLGSPLAAGPLGAQSVGAAAPVPEAPALAGPDPAPEVNDIAKYPSCHYCGMDRRRFHHTRMLVHYGDGTVDPLCSLRCAVTSLTLHLGKVPRAIWVGDNAAGGDPMPLTDAEKATYLIDSSIRGVMTRRSKVAYSTPEAAARARAEHGGETAAFDATLLAAYTDVAESVSRYLATNAERLKKRAERDAAK
ncbi:MAG: nitrous oxide reductase accessory protein NosL [Vicinamibacteria bacterium]